MDRNEFVAVFFLFFILVNVSDASFIGKFRKLLGVPTNNNSTNTGNSALPSSVSGGNESLRNPIIAKTPTKEESNDTQVPTDSSNVDPKGSNNTGSGSLPIQKQKDSGQNNHEERKNNGTQNDSGTGTVGNCDGLPYKCRIEKMIACVQSFGSGSKEVVLHVQNEGESSRKVNITVPNPAKNAFKEEVEILKHQTKKINIPLTTVEGTKIALNASNGGCVIHIGSPVSERNISPQFLYYSKLVTPIYGAGFLFLMALIVGGSWACCKFRKRRELGGVPYQELEMGLPAPVSAVDLETAEGWDQGWDDDWDEDKAVKSPGGRHVGSISGSGLTSRSSKKDGWGNDWDD